MPNASAAYRLRDGVSICVTSGRVVALDLDRDRYFCLNKDADRAIQRILGQERPGAADSGYLDACAAQGLLIAGSNGAPIEVPVATIARADLLDRATISPFGVGAIQALGEQFITAQRLRRRPLRRIVEDLRALKAAPRRPRPGNALAEGARAFESAQWIASKADTCLLRSLSLTSYLVRRGVQVRMIIGVRLNPFRAHCWVQSDDIVVNDTADYVRTFSPILVL